MFIYVNSFQLFLQSYLYTTENYKTNIETRNSLNFYTRKININAAEQTHFYSEPFRVRWYIIVSKFIIIAPHYSAPK